MLLPRAKRRAFTLTEMLVVVFIICFLFALLLPSVRRSGGAARRNGCSNNLHNIGLAIQNHHGARNYLPALTSTNVTTAIPGSVAAAPETAGYSWIVRILPYLEESVLYKTIATNSQGFTLPAFADTITNNGQPMSATNPHLSMTQLQILRCPAYGNVQNSTAPQYARFLGHDQNDKLSAREPLTGCAVSNYAAITATHLACLTATQSDGTAEPPNGIIVPPVAWKTRDDGRTTPMGINFKSITDGLSRTVMIAETREPRFSAWYDGTVNYVVGAAPNSPPPRKDLGGNGFWNSEGAGKLLSALNQGPVPNNQNFYRSSQHFANGGGTNWDWGPSSYHAGGDVAHLYADGSVTYINDDIDPALYLHLVTRAGGEPVERP